MTERTNGSGIGCFGLILLTLAVWLIGSAMGWDFGGNAADCIGAAALSC